MSAVFKKELRAYFTSPIGYVVLALLVFFASFAFVIINMYRGVTTLSYVFQFLLSYAVLPVIPVLTMRLFSEEKRQKTDQALFTAPTSITGIVIGKYLAAVALFAIGLSITLVFAIIIAFQATPEWMIIIGNYLGMLLLGCLLIGIGMLLSALTESQFIAALTTFGISYMLLYTESLSSIFQNIPHIPTIISFFSIPGRYYNFTSGLINYDDLIFFLSIQALFIFLTIGLLDRKRWS